jgi:hypothetical protein
MLVQLSVRFLREEMGRGNLVAPAQRRKKYKMKYSLTKRVIGYLSEIHISEAEFRSLKNAKKSLLSGLAIEEKYEVLLSNYEDYELEILKQAAQLMLRYDRDYDTLFNTSLALNKRIINLLTACRLYVDQISHNIKDIIKEDIGIEDKVKQLFIVEYESHFEYRFMEALRNYVQHRGFPIQITQFIAFSRGTGQNRKLIFTMNMASEKRFLQEDVKFKKEVLNETPEEVDLKAVTRTYIECLSKIHVSIRNIISDNVNNDRGKIESAITRFQKEIDKKAVGLAAVCKDWEGKIVDEIPLLLDWDDIRKKLIERNRSLTNLVNRYVSGEIN